MDMELNKLKIKIFSNMGQSASVFGVALLEYMKTNDRVMVLSADMSNNAGLDKFRRTYPDHFINVGISEQNMIGVAAGFASEGYKVIVEAQSCFLSMRSFEQLRQYSGYMKFPIVFVGINAGLSLTYMGNTHFSVEDIGLVRNIPGLNVISPCDAGEAVKAFEAALNSDSSTYLRLMGSLGTKAVYSDDFQYEIGQPILLREGDDIQILATGNMVALALDVADRLEEDGICAQVLDVHTLKPFQVDCLSLNSKLIVTLEEHTIVSGLGSVVGFELAKLSSHPKLLAIGLEDGYGKVGDYDWMLENRGLSVENILRKIKVNI
jgi:transketolase